MIDIHNSVLRIKLTNCRTNHHLHAPLIVQEQYIQLRRLERKIHAHCNIKAHVRDAAVASLKLSCVSQEGTDFNNRSSTGHSKSSTVGNFVKRMFQTYFDILYISVGQYQAEEKGLVRPVHSYASKSAKSPARMLVRVQIFLLVNLSDYELYRAFW